MARVWADSKHAGTELLMLLAIADFADDDGNAYPAVTTLAAKCRMKPRNANYILADLQASGELEVRVNEGPKGTNRYRITLVTTPEGVQRVAGDGVQRSAGVGLQAGAGVQRSAGLQSSAPTPAMECAKPLQCSADEPSLNHQEPSSTSLSRRDDQIPDCPQQQIRQLYAELLPSLPQPKKWDADRQKTLRTRWRDQAKEKGWVTVDEGVAWFRRFFTAVSENDWAMGRAGRGRGHENWECDIDYLLSVKGFRRIIESAGRVKEAA
jgi:hypothetical protein